MHSLTLSFSLTKGTGEGGGDTAGSSAVVGDLRLPTCIIRLVPVFSRSVPWILGSVPQHTICFCNFTKCIFLALAMMGQTLHKTLWCLMHLLLFLLSLMSECFGIIKCTVSINGSFFLSTGLGGGGEGNAASTSSSDTSSWTVSSSSYRLQEKAVPRRGVLGILDEPPCYIPWGYLLANTSLKTTN